MRCRAASTRFLSQCPRQKISARLTFIFIFSALLSSATTNVWTTLINLSPSPRTTRAVPPLLSPPTVKINTAGTDQLLLDIADYVIGYEIKSKDAVKTARYAIMDSLVGWNRDGGKGSERASPLSRTRRHSSHACTATPFSHPLFRARRRRIESRLSSNMTRNKRTHADTHACVCFFSPRCTCHARA